MFGRGGKVNEVRKNIPDHIKAILDTVGPVLDDRYDMVTDTLRGRDAEFVDKLNIVKNQQGDDFGEDRA